MKEPGFAGDRIELLQTFIRIVEGGSLSAAAQRMNTTQPTVSRRLKALEQFFGVKLLQRSTHAIKLTPDGERCFALAGSLVEEWQSMDEAIRGVQDEPTGTLKVLVPHAFGQAQLVAPLVRYLQAFPQVRVEWLLHDRRPDFVAEGIDCAVQVGTVVDPTVVAVHLFDVPRIVVGAARLPEQPAPALEPAQLKDCPWLALQTFYQDRVVLNRLRDGATESFDIKPRMSTDSLYALRTAAIAGLGIGIVSAWVVEEDLRAGRLVHLVPDWAAASLPVYLVYPHARHYPARLRRFLDAIRRSA
jgi:DNA-binding transcriptional LysR family regulator